MFQHRIASRHRAPRQRGAVFGRRVAVVLAAVAALGVSDPLRAATVNAVQGQVLVNTGQGYRLVDGSAQLGPGGTVVANPGAVAQVVYGADCKVTVEPGSVYLIAARPPCNAGEPTNTGGLTDNRTARTSSGVNYWLIGGAAALVGGGVAYYVATLSP